MTIDHKTAKAPRTVPDGQTPLDDNLNHRLLDVIRDGEAARDAWTGSPYHGHSLEHCLHATGWVARDLRLALNESQARAKKAEAERDRVAAEWAEVSQRNYRRAKAAEAERDALRAALVERVAAAMWSAEAMRAALNVGHTRTPERFASWLCLAEAAIRAMPVAEPEPQAVKVKPLEFEGRNGFWRAADGLGGFYEICEVNGGFHMTRITLGVGSAFVTYPTIDAAQAAANADHAARILSQIDAVSVAQVRAEALREAATLPPYDGDGDQAGQFDHHVFVKLDAIRALIKREPT